VTGRDPLADFHPLVRSWFREEIGAPSAPQRAGWPAISSGSHTLILAPTGTGKTLAAFLWEIDRLIAEGREAGLPNATRLVYVSPLKALGNDIERNLNGPLVALRQRFEAAGDAFPEIRVAVRTGDTTASARARMRRKAPHVLITTPESLHILLTSERARTMFAGVRAVIVDEIHAMAGSKRGSHLALTLERLEEHVLREGAELGTGGAPQRIGLSATQRPLEEVARYLGGCEVADPARGKSQVHEAETGALPAPAPDELAFRPVRVVDCGLVKALALRIVTPLAREEDDLGITVWHKVVDVLHGLSREARTMLVFTNNRAQAEKLAARLNTEVEADLAQPYHGSLSRERREMLETALKAGTLRVLVATSALELGIDIGSVDLVVQVQSPKRVAAALQRVGRAGHQLEAVSRGVLIPTYRDDVVEIAAIAGGMLEGAVEATVVPQNALDVLAQIVIAAAAMEERSSAGLFALVRRAYPFHRLTRAAFDAVLEMAAGGAGGELGADLEPRITWDRLSDRVSAPRRSRMLAVTSGGTIPDRGLYAVLLPDRTRLGELDEEFVHESRVGDVFQLGSSTWRILSIEHDRVIVRPAPGAPARMPFWRGEFLARSAELGRRVGALRRLASDDAPEASAALAAMAGPQGWDSETTRVLREYVGAQRAATGTVPDEHTLLLERFADETGAPRIVLHSVFGGRVNAPWGLALARRCEEALGAEVQVQTSDEGILLRLPAVGGDPPLELFERLMPDEAERTVIEAVRDSALFGARFRMNAARALVLPRDRPGKRMPLWLQRLRAADLLEAVRHVPDFPLIVETYREILQDAFDLAALRHVLGEISAGRIRLRYAETEQPSPFAAGLMFGFVMEWLYGDDAPRAERRAALLAVDQGLLDEVMGTETDPELETALDETLASRRGTAQGRRARSADELAHLLERAGDLTMEELRERVADRDAWRRGDPVEELLESGRIIGLAIPTGENTSEWRWILTERYGRYAAAFGLEQVAVVQAGTAHAETPAAEVVPEVLRQAALSHGAARREMLARWLALAGPVTASEIGRRYALPDDWVARRLAEWQRSGRLVRGRYRRAVAEPQWLVSSVAEIARRRALAALRRQIAAVELPVYAVFLQRWQHLDPRERLRDLGGAERVMLQLAGLARPAAVWERDILPARLERYDPAWLSQLAASGGLAWSGVPARTERDGATMLASVRFYPRGAAAVWSRQAPPDDSVLSAGARAVRDALRRAGASFLSELGEATGLTGLSLRDALRELVAHGLATNDTVEALREIARARPLPARDDEADEAARWLPRSYVPTPGRPVVQRRANLRRLPRWRRPDAGDAPSGWVGRWSLVRAPAPDAETLRRHAEAVARQWLDRYGIVARDWYRRERPPVAWRAIYEELKRMEYRGEVRRGYFVRGLAGAQFALPEAVERLRAAADDEPDAPFVVMSSADPANAHALPLHGVEADRLARPRGRAVLVLRRGLVILSVEGRGRRIALRERTDAETLSGAIREWLEYVRRAQSASRRRRDITIETIDGASALRSPHADIFRAAGFRLTSDGLRWYAAI
jgi:ATP-dependent Lhr-like helicase